MSSALAMVLMAAMAVPGSGPDKVSGELEEGLDLRGEWVGITRNYSGGFFEAVLRMDGSKVRIDVFWLGEWVSTDFLEIIDEGKGKFRGRLDREKRPFLGIYEQHGDHVAFCYCEGEDERPSSMKRLDNILLILHRVKPRK